MKRSELLKTKQERVKEILTRLPETRDCDREMIAAYWRVEQPMLFAFRNAEAVLRAIVNKELSNPEDITRTRRKMQEIHPELRGKDCRTKKRHDDAEDVRSAIKKKDFEINMFLP